MSDHDDQPTGPSPRTEQERELLAIYAELDEPDRVLLWCALLAELDRCSTALPDDDEAPASRPEIP